MKIVIHHGGSCSADACGVAVCFSRTMDLGAAKQVVFEKKSNSVNVKNSFKKGKKNLDGRLRIYDFFLTQDL
jgi:hypothetical protein